MNSIEQKDFPKYWNKKPVNRQIPKYNDIKGWKKGMDPLVSVCCITYNHEKYIRDAVESFLIQKTKFPFEILIHDDASTDHTAEIIREYELLYPEIIKPVYQTENQYSKGIKAINTKFNLSRANGKYLALCDGDDYWTNPHKLQIQADAMEDHADCDISFHPATMKFDDGREPDRIHGAHSDSDKIFTVQEVIQGGGGFCPTASLMIKRNILNKLPEWIEEFPGPDYFIQIIASLNGGALYLNQNMAVYRKGHPGAWTENLSNLSFRVQHRTEINEYLNKLDSYLNFRFNEFIQSTIREQTANFLTTLERNLDGKNSEIQKKDAIIEDLKQRIEQIGFEKERAINEVKSSYAYRIGKGFTYPFRKVKFLNDLINNKKNIIRS